MAGARCLSAALTEAALHFGPVEISPAQRALRVHGQAVELGRRAFDLLVALAQRHERLVNKQELLDLVWPGLVVEEHNIATHISTPRKLLGAGAIATVPGPAYRFVAPRADGRATRDGPGRDAELAADPSAARTHCAARPR